MPKSGFAGLMMSLFTLSGAAVFDWPEADTQGSLRLRFRLEEIDSTFALPSRAENGITQTLLLDTPRFRVNLNTDPTKTTLHFFLFADEAENGPWALHGAERLQGVPESPYKMGVVDLSHLKGGRDYELWINWDLEARTLSVWLNGELQGDPFTANRQPWIPAPPRDTPARAGTELSDGSRVFPLRILAAEAFSPPAGETRVHASAAGLARLENEGRVVFTAPINLDAHIQTLRYAPDLSQARILAESELFDAEGRRVRAPAEDEWVLEGGARATATPQGLILDTRPEGEDTPEITAAAGHLVLWAPADLPENFLLEYDFQPESPRRGLHILFWNARERSGADIFDPDSGLPFRDGSFSHYTWRRLNSYHASLFATDDEEPRRVANLRKNSGFVLAACGDDAVYGAEGPVRIRLLRDGPLMRIEANGREVMRYTDDGTANGPPLSGGRFGFRIMAHTGRATISSLRLYELTPKPTEAAAQTLLDFKGLEAEAIPDRWRIEGDQNQSRLHQDPLVEGRGYLQLRQSGDAPTTLRIPVPLPDTDGRLTLRMSVRSPQSKWFQLTLTRNGERLWSHNLALGRHWREEGLEVEVKGQERQSPHWRGEGGQEHRRGESEFGGMRPGGGEYGVLGDALLGTPKQHQNNTPSKRISDKMSEAELSLSFHGEGGVDLESLSLSFQDSAAVAESLNATERPGHANNLLRNSRLLHGLPSGWHLDRTTDDGTGLTISTDPDFRLQTQRPAAFFSEPFTAVRPGELHTAAFTVHGEADGHAQVFQDGRPLSERVAFTAGEDPQTVRVPFIPAPLARLSTLRVDIHGDATFDAFAVYADAHPPGGRAEVSLGAPRLSRVVFHDEPLTLDWTVTLPSALRTPHSSPPTLHSSLETLVTPHSSFVTRHSSLIPNALLHARVVNLYGETTELRPVHLTGDARQHGTLNADLFPARPLGQFRIEARVETPEGEALGPWNELVITRLQRPEGLGEPRPDSPFGIHVPATARHLEMAGALGLRWVRLHDIGGNMWFHLEPRPGEWRFQDDGIHRLRAAGFDILGVLVSTPLWANAWPDGPHEPIHSYWDQFGMPGDLDAFANYVRVFTKRYADEIAAHEVWNEPWVPRFFSARREPQPVGEPEYFHSANPQADYAALSRAAREGAGPDVLLAGLNSSAGATLAHRISGTDWSRGVLEAGGVSPVDVVTYHHYTPARAGYPGDDVEAGFHRAIGPLLDTGLTPRVWMTEGSNTPGGLPGSFYRHTLPHAAGPDAAFDPAAAADALVRYLVAMLAAGTEKIFLYSMHAHGLWGRQDRFTTLVQPDGYLHPDAAALSALTFALEGTRFISRERGEDHAVRYRFENDTRRVTVLLPHPDHPVPALPGTLDLWGNPARGPLWHPGLILQPLQPETLPARSQ
ncbi:MAG: DUF1961 family protein [Verrucomicrobia bacterium]|nr:DUF1961 family protein [Verrucomicrobiota bacterium]MCH8527528.1 YesU family protein [Kiritimatiellia bacterium]